MPKVVVQDDGWVMLPARLRKALGLDVGDQLEAEFAGGRIVLRVGKASLSGQVSEDVPARGSINNH
jgi:bifunctional DNA-binding transcriptional regulator/antitoxin component of YhaV-PrlF toxin-antitoxin module